MNFTKEDLRKRINELNRYRNEYYNNNIALISDYEYDKLFDELKEIEDVLDIYYPDSPTQQVGYTVVSNLEKVKHEYLLLSLDKTKSIMDIVNFVNIHPFIISAKMDGLTICLTYENGNLIKAETRGDGVEGELVTHNISTFKNVPKTIPYKEHLVVVGEAILTKDKLDIVNKDLPEDKKYKHVRNLVSGTVRQLDSSVCANREPIFIAWDCRTNIAKTLGEKFEQLNRWGFTIVPYIITYGGHRNNINSLKEQIEINIEDIKTICKEFNYPIDGMVITYDNIEYGNSLGQTSHHFKNAIAYKFYDEETISKLIGIDWTMGRTGVLTPVALINPIDIDGTTISRASLHNVSILKNLKLTIGDEVTVYKANQIIPQIGENLTNHSKQDNFLFDNIIPTICPYCGAKTKQITNNESTVLICTNNDCWAKKLEKFTHFVSKSCMNIVGLSEQSIKLFLEKGWIYDPMDFYTLTFRYHYEDIINTDGWSTVSVDKLFKAINDSRNVKLENAINALGIDNVGIKASKEIAKFCKYDWHNFINPKYYEHLNQIDGFGEIMCKSVINKVRYDYMYINDLFSEFNFIDNITNNSNILESKSFVITGSLIHYKNRDELVSVIESNGGKVASSVSAKTDYLINNDINSNSGKNKKAKELNIPIITEDDFRTMVAVIGVDLAQNTDFVGETAVSIKDLETRGMTEHEQEVYNDMLKNGAVKTGRKLF